MYHLVIWVLVPEDCRRGRSDIVFFRLNILNTISVLHVSSSFFASEHLFFKNWRVRINLGSSDNTVVRILKF
jgi:hypothetical protein